MSQYNQEEENRREYNRQENQREERNRYSFYSEENQIVDQRITKERENRSKQYLEDGNLLGYSVENNLPLSESSFQEGSTSDLNLSEEDASSMGISENSALDYYQVQSGDVYRMKEQLMAEIQHILRQGIVILYRS